MIKKWSINGLKMVQKDSKNGSELVQTGLKMIRQCYNNALWVSCNGEVEKIICSLLRENVTFTFYSMEFC